MSLEIEKVRPEAVAEMRRAYWATLSGPQDAYWQEGLIAASDHLGLRIEGRRAGYFVLDAQKQMMQFHVDGRFLRGAPDIFKHVRESQGVETAFAATIEPFYFGLGLKPICSCEAGNVGSRKAVENAGFITRHRVVRFAL